MGPDPMFHVLYETLTYIFFSQCTNKGLQTPSNQIFLEITKGPNRLSYFFSATSRYCSSSSLCKRSIMIYTRKARTYISL